MGTRLTDKVAFLTGAGSGIARASAHLFAREGAKIVVADIDEPRGRQVCRDITQNGSETLFVPVDVTDAASVEAALAAAVTEFGKLDILLNAAGGSVKEDRSVTSVDLDVWEHTINLDLKGPFLCCKFGIPHLIAAGGGTIVNFSSVVALKGNFPAHVYSSAKGGIISLTQALAGRYWRDNIRANAIAPGLILSERILERSAIDPTSDPNQQMETARLANARIFDDRHPYAVGVPEDIANVALFLASDESRMVNGAVIPAEGGLSKY
jgi:NAD(P)-dependent dehydrogenase (short-subunit alcohol dehydrogenase family)